MDKSAWKISVEKCDLLLENTEGHQVVSIGMLDRLESKITNKGLIKLDQMPKKWCEIYGMNRFSGKVTTLRDVKNFWGKVLPILFLLSDGNPLVWQCSKKHARFYRLTFKRHDEYKFSFIAGSLAGGKPIYDNNSLTGGSDDEQIVMLGLSENK